MHDIDEKASLLQDKINALDDFSQKTKLPHATVEKIKKFFRKNQEADNEIIDPYLLADLPVAVRANIMIHTHKDIIETVSFLKETEKTLLWLILPLMKPMRFYEKDLIYRQQENAQEVYFLYEGEVTLSLDINDNRNGKPVYVPFNKYTKGSYFGDNDIFCKQLRDSTAMCITEVNILVLSEEDLKIMMEKDDKVAHKMALLAYERNNEHHRRMVHSLVVEDKVNEFATKLYPDTDIKRNTAAEHSRTIVREYLESRPMDELTKNE